ncbi:unnamed protein product [Owenia fusiformis]|uniref:Uncharacterized protein n=1 Tax=Owenia fusiformis TaxID=6347 RepID=A0A8S4PYK7_OWEFU|nr:unnamed protein product [Owenia fusiformis]
MQPMKDIVHDDKQFNMSGTTTCTICKQPCGSRTSEGLCYACTLLKNDSIKSSRVKCLKCGSSSRHSNRGLCSKCTTDAGLPPVLQSDESSEKRTFISDVNSNK